MRHNFYTNGKKVIKKVYKTWGWELHIVNRHDYCGKLLVIIAGKYGSMHYHLKKTETFYLQSGKVRIESRHPETAEPWQVILNPGDSLHVPAGTLHQIVGLEDSELFEFSTTDSPDDSYRVTPTCP